MFKGISEGKFPAFSRKTTENVSVYKIYVSITILYLKSGKSVVYCISERTFRGFGKGFRETPEESGMRNRK